MKIFSIFIIAINVVLSLSSVLTLAVGQLGRYTHQVDIEDDLDRTKNILIQWVNFEDRGEKWLEIQVDYPTSGYVGLGLSPHGGMEGADIVIGWVDENGQAFSKDMQGVGNLRPVIDQTQNWELLDGTELNGRTQMTFKRLWDTGDPQDFKITDDTMRLIWAYTDSDPMFDDKEPENLFNFNYHGSENRGVRSIFIESSPKVEPFPDDEPNGDPNIKWFDVKMNNTQVEAVHTTYMCKIIKFPKLEKKHQFVGFKPILQPENKRNIHHFCLYECVVPGGNSSGIFDSHLENPGEKCYTASMPEIWPVYCSNFLFCWIIGSDGEMFSKHVGSPLGDQTENSKSTANYFMVEIHYNQPETDLRQFTDSSGIRLFYTDQLREYDSGMISMGHRVSPFHLIPKQQAGFLTNGICSSECTQKGFPAEGIKILSVLLHAHLTGSKLRLRHFRNGKELEVLAEDNHYDWNYQQTRVLKKEVAILPGDELLTECEYNTTDRVHSTTGGLSAQEEMCIAFLFYYPRIEMTSCTSQPEFYTFLNSFGVKNVSGDVLKTLKMPYEPSQLPLHEQEFEPFQDTVELEKLGLTEGLTIYDLMEISDPGNLANLSMNQLIEDKLDWQDPKISSRAQETLNHGLHYAFCTSYAKKRIMTKNHKVYLPSSTLNDHRYQALSSSSGIKFDLYTCILPLLVLLMRF